MDFFSRQYIEIWSIPEPMSGCWLWLGQLDKDGYGQFRRFSKDKWNKAHQVSYEVYCREIGDFHVLHRCDVPGCVNPDHLFLGTPLDNVRDMDAKGRRVTVGNKNPPGSHCKKGHPFSGENLRIAKTGQQICRECNRRRCAEYHYNNRESIILQKRMNRIQAKYVVR